MINQVTLAGNTGSDVDLQFSKTNTAIAYVRLATSEKYNGEEKTTWHNIKAFGKLAETMAKYVSKGKKIMVQGKLDYYNWEKDGVKHTKTEIIVEKMFFLDSNNSQQSVKKEPDGFAQDDFAQDDFENDIPLFLN